MANYLYQNRWLIGLRGLMAVIFGVMALIWPGAAALALVTLLAVYLIIDGVLSIITAVRNREENDRWWLGLLEGIVGIAAGAIAIASPGLASVTLVLVIAVWAIVTGILEIAAAIRLRREIDNEWSLGLAGLASVILGIIMVVNPGAGLLGLVWAIAGYAIVFGFLLIYLAFTARRFADRVHATGEGARVYEK